MEYITAKEAGSKWGITTRRVQALCENGQVDGATRLGNSWAIPRNTKKPIDGRTKAAKQATKDVYKKKDVDRNDA